MQAEELIDKLIYSALNYGYGKKDFNIIEDQNKIELWKGESYFRIDITEKLLSYQSLSQGSNIIEDYNSMAIPKQFKSWLQGLNDIDRSKNRQVNEIS